MKRLLINTIALAATAAAFAQYQQDTQWEQRFTELRSMELPATDLQNHADGYGKVVLQLSTASVAAGNSALRGYIYWTDYYGNQSGRLELKAGLPNDRFFAHDVALYNWDGQTVGYVTGTLHKPNLSEFNGQACLIVVKWDGTQFVQVTNAVRLSTTNRSWEACIAQDHKGNFTVGWSDLTRVFGARISYRPVAPYYRITQGAYEVSQGTDYFESEDVIQDLDVSMSLDGVSTFVAVENLGLEHSLVSWQENRPTGLIDSTKVFSDPLLRITGARVATHTKGDIVNGSVWPLNTTLPFPDDHMIAFAVNDFFGLNNTLIYAAGKYMGRHTDPKVINNWAGEEWFAGGNPTISGTRGVYHVAWQAWDLAGFFPASYFANEILSRSLRLDGNIWYGNEMSLSNQHDINEGLPAIAFGRDREYGPHEMAVTYLRSRYSTDPQPIILEQDLVHRLTYVKF